MDLSLTGVLEDGTPRSSGVPANPRKALRVPLGIDLVLHLTVLRPDGSNVDLAGATLVWTVKKKPSDVPAAISKVGVVGGGEAKFTLVPNDTKQLSPGLFGYDVWMTQGGKRDPVVPLSPLLLEAAATLPP